MSHAALQLAAHRQMTASDIQGGTLTWFDQTLPCTIGTPHEMQKLDLAGVSNETGLIVEAAAADFSASPQFTIGAPVIVKTNQNAIYNCKLESWSLSGVLWQLTLNDINQGA